MQTIPPRGLVYIMLVACVAVAGCTNEAPTETEAAGAPPSLSTGVGFGSGNYSDGDSATVQTTEAADSTESAASTGGERTGVGFGSGN